MENATKGTIKAKAKDNLK
jgi:hypothetical protein